MAIIGFNFDKINAEKIKPATGEVKINHHVKILDIKEEEVNLGKKQTAVKFKFSFDIKYEPNIGNIDLEGSVLYMGDDKKTKELLDNWKKDKTIRDQILTSSLMNTILEKSNIKVLNISQDLNLPPTLPMPKAAVQESPKNRENYIG